MKAPFEPHGDVGETTVANPLIAAGKTLYISQGCISCHGENGRGTKAAPKLSGVASNYESARLEEMLRTPTDAMSLGGMESVDLKPDQMNALTAYIKSLR